MKTKKPSAIVYGWYKEGEEILISDVYFEEGLEDQTRWRLDYNNTTTTTSKSN